MNIIKGSYLGQVHYECHTRQNQARAAKNYVKFSLRANSSQVNAGVANNRWCFSYDVKITLFIGL